MTQSAEASSNEHPLTGSARVFGNADALWLGVGAIAVAATGFLLHQLMAWPPHEDETLALFVGRDSLGGVVEHVTRERGGAPLHFLFAYAVAHLGFGLGALRLVSAAFAVGSLPLVALLGRRLADRRTALIATALVAGSWVFLFHGVYARMYSLFLFLSLLSFVLLLRALDRRKWLPWAAVGCLDPARSRIPPVRSTRTRGAGSFRAGRPPRAAAADGDGVPRRGRRRDAVLAHRSRPRRPLRRGGRWGWRKTRRSVGRRDLPVANRGRLQHRALARPRPRPPLRPRRVRHRQNRDADPGSRA